ncbi:MAG: hypothetical protein QF911_00580 [Candidatus Thalassarchaeaceae archaeon]|jgi:hypothetical protein|nr:hypothetical protein [Candidatus Thalassarchaeaceae archaeon]
MALISAILSYWAAIFVVYIMLNRGIWIFTDVSKGMSMFMLEKALGPAIDFAEGRKSSGARTWIIQGALWLIPASTLTFAGLWLKHDPVALHSLASWGYSPSSEALLLAGNLTAFYGAVGMLMVGAGLHIVPTLGGTNLASERNASLMSFVWTLSVVVMIIGAHNPEILGLKILLMATALHSLSLLAIIVNLLLTAASRTRKMPLPAWLIVVGMLSDPVSIVILALLGMLDSGVGQWMLVRLISGGFFFMQAAGVALYASSQGTGNPLWSRSLAAVTMLGALLSLNPLGDTTGALAADLLGFEVAAFTPSRNDVIAASFLMALASIPIIALSSNIIVTMRGDDVFMENPDSPGMPEINLGALMLVPLGIGALFVQTDALRGLDELSGISSSLLLMVAWLILVPLALGSALSIFPEVAGRNLLSNIRSRWAFWMMAGGSFSGLIITMMADFSEMALMEAAVEEGSNISNELRAIGSVLFYGTVIGSILHCLNMISGTFRGSLVEEAPIPSSTSIEQPSFNLTTGTTVRKILARGANLDTEVVPVSQSDAPGSPTEL